MSNSVAEVLEAVANAEKKRYNTISSEDMLHRIHQYNKDVTLARKTWLENKTRKLQCRKCKIMESVDCPRTEEHGWDLLINTNNTNNTQEQTQEAEKITNNECCGQEIEAELEFDCTECGPGVNKLQVTFSVFGNDVKALYPSIQSEKSGKIIRERVENSALKLEGFCPKKGLAYIAMNRSLTSDIAQIEHLLPKRKSTSKNELKMSAITTSWDPETRFEYTQEEFTIEETRIIAARVIEIGTRTLFENHMYRFGDIVYKQEQGGSIGDRWTGSAAEIIMQDWSEKYKNILVRSGLEVYLLAGYVDDGRQGTSTLPMGMEFDKNENKFVYRTEAEQEDLTRKAEGESTNQRMARRCIKAMNSINSNLEFTVECQEEFDNEKLPTLDFAIWQEENGIINHTYFQKPTKTPYVIMSRSGAATQQKIKILSNELARRLGNINKNNTTQQKLNRVVDQLTQELKCSEYSQQTAQEIITSGIRCWQTRIKRKEQKGQEQYRPAQSTLKTRKYKKLMARETWYKNKQEPDQDNTPQENIPPKHKQDQNIHQNPPKKPRTSTQTQEEQEHQIKPESKIKAVMFVPFTPGSELAKLLRENEERIVKLTNSKLKIVERAGVKLQDVLTKSNPWKGVDCQRSNCLLCHTKTKQENAASQDCHKRSLIYETWCITCERLELDKIEEQDLGEHEKTELKRKIKKYKYVGETGRSAYERGWEHLNDLAQLRTSSHMLKHCIGVHENSDMGEIQFGMKVIQYSKSSFERQIRESVQIQAERKDHHLLNSRSEYNRCSVPRLSAQMGDSEYKKVEKEIEEEKRKEEKLEYKIRQMRKEKTKARLPPTKASGPAKKRRKLETTEYVTIEEIWGEPEYTEPEKRKDTTEQEQESKRQRTTGPRPPRGSPSPGKELYGGIRLTNLRTVERTIQAPERNAEQEEEWEKKIKEHREQILKEEREKMARLEKQKKKEESWELYRLCKEFLEENSVEWEQRRKEREREQERLERVTRAKNKTRIAQLKLLRKNVDEGLKKLPIRDREQIENEEKRKEREQLKQTKQDLWKLRKKEKKCPMSDSLKEIRTLAQKAVKITEILKKEKQREQEQKEKEQKEKELKRTREQEKITRIEKQKKLQEKWAMYRWITEYIDENSALWEQERKDRQEQENKRIAEWEKKNRFEKIKELRRISAEKIEQNKQEKLSTENENKKQVWRTTPKPKVQKEHTKPDKSPKITEKIEKTKITVKLKQPTLQETRENKTQKQRTIAKPRKPKLTENTLKSMQGFWVKYATKCKEANRIDKSVNNRVCPDRSGNSQIVNDDNPDHRNFSESAGCTIASQPGCTVQISLEGLEPVQRSNSSEITHRGQVDCGAAKII